MARQRRSYAHPPSADDDDTSDDYDSDQESDLDDGRHVQLALRDKEEALVESALARIRRAQERGKKEVKLNKEELAALERRRERIQAEASRKSSSSGTEHRRRKEKEQRLAVPISQLDPTSRKPNGDDNIPRRPSSGDFSGHREQRGYPQMGYFPPPTTRARSGTTSSQRRSSRDPARHRDSSPFRYSYVQHPNPPPATRHVSDTATRPRSSRGPLPHEEAWVPNPNSYASASAPTIPRPGSRHQAPVDPFQYMTTGPHAPYHAVSGGGPSAAPARRHVSGPQGDTRYGQDPREAPPAAARGKGATRRASSEETSETASEEDDESTSDELGHGAPVQTNSPRRTSRDAIVAEVERESPERPQPRTSKKLSPVKRKPVASGSSSRRRKK